jgi:hypothetical protein
MGLRADDSLSLLFVLYNKGIASDKTMIPLKES